MAALQFRAVFDVVFAGRVTADISDAATGSGTFGSVGVAVPGVLIGDHVLVDAVAAETAGAPVVGKVLANGTVTLMTMNNSAGAVNYASGLYNLTVLRLNYGR